MIPANLTLLGIQEGFSQAELRSAYRAQVRRVHPDLARDGADRDRRTRETVRLNAAYAELRKGPACGPPQTPPSNAPGADAAGVEIGPIPRRSRRTPCPTRDTIYALAGAFVAGIAASTVTGNLPISVAVLVGGTVLARWGHALSDTPGIR